MMTPLLTTNEVCEVLRISPNTLRKLVETKELVGMQVGSQWRFTRAAIDRYLEAAQPQPAAETADTGATK